ncbi:MAG: exopolyphosphatase [Gammaproteobacteria bacterium]|nr:MAG: exopolyphosphatase [Gammaproteobacteria bacterium]
MSAVPESEIQSASDIAAVDLGSNSFHLIVARPSDDALHVVDRLRDMIRLGAGLDENRILSEQAMTRALDCLAKFGQRIRHLAPENVRIVGTNTLRVARNAQAFLQHAQAVLGHDIEIISGVEEARLIYLGVSRSLSGDEGRRLVMDIGGGSTELIVGTQKQPLHMQSLYMGCVSMSHEYFSDGRITNKAFNNAILAARLELEPHEAIFRNLGWQMTIGASGTLRAVEQVLHEADWSKHGITKDGLKKLRESLCDSGHVEKIKLPGLDIERAPVFPGGVAITIAAFEALEIDHMQISDGALREGVVFDLIGRHKHIDVREATIGNFAQRFHTDTLHAERIQTTAQACLAQIEDDWDLGDAVYSQYLRWAAQLHEVGLDIAHGQYHKHGAYIIQNADLLGFSRQEQLMLATLIRAHRRKFPVSVFNELPEDKIPFIQRLAILLRLAVVLHRSRNPTQIPLPAVTASKHALELTFPDGWLDEHPLTNVDLSQEAAYLKEADFKLKFG